MESRRSIAAVAFVALVVTSGCIGFVTGEEALEYDAEQVGLSEESRQTTGYERTARDEVVVERTVSDRDVKVSNWYARYEKYDEIAEETSGIFSVFSTHRVDVFGRTTNPYATMSHEEILANLTAEYDTELGAADDLTFVENRSREVLGQPTTVGVFKTTTQFDGETIEVKLYITRVRHGDDYVVAIGAHPTKLPAGEQDILTLMEGIEHDADEDDQDERISPGNDVERLTDAPVGDHVAAVDERAASTAQLAVRVAE